MYIHTNLPGLIFLTAENIKRKKKQQKTASKHIWNQQTTTKLTYKTQYCRLFSATFQAFHYLLHQDCMGFHAPAYYKPCKPAQIRTALHQERLKKKK